jgi:hypothetical protein
VQVLAMIGEQLNTADVCGVVVSMRPQVSRVALWVRDGDNEKSFIPLG